MSWRSFHLSYASALILLTMALSLSALAEDPALVAEPDTSVHPLASIIRYANSLSDYIHEHVCDYSCLIIKRERINGALQQYHYLRANVRCEKRHEDRLAEPMAVFLQYLSPAQLKDRRVLYIEGKNDGMMLVRKGGGIMRHLRLTIDPDSRTARRDSNYPITDLGLDRVIDRLVERAKKDIENDPTGSNTLVSYLHNAKVNDRVCTHIQVTHPKSSDGLIFHTADLFIDDELHVPIRLAVHGWATGPDEESPLIEEYNYTNLQLNVGLTEANFSEANLSIEPN